MLPRRTAPGAAPARTTGTAARAILIVLLLALHGAQAAELPHPRQVLILARALAYDRNLKVRTGGTIVVGVLSKRGDRSSEAMADSVAQAFRAMEAVKVQGLPLRTLRLSFDGPGALQAAGAQGVNTLYVCSGLDGDLPAISGFSRQRKALTIGSSEAQVERGLSLGVFAGEAKPTIRVNLPASKAEGVSFDPEFLRLAELVP
jgi:hypothetical protein